MTGTDDFKRAVVSCLELIQDKHLNKIVLAHALISSSAAFNLIQSLKICADFIRLLHLFQVMARDKTLLVQVQNA